MLQLSPSQTFQQCADQVLALPALSCWLAMAFRSGHTGQSSCAPDLNPPRLMPSHTAGVVSCFSNRVNDGTRELTTMLSEPIGTVSCLANMSDVGRRSGSLAGVGHT